MNKIKVDFANQYRISKMVEDICDKYNLHNYFGLISTSVEKALDLVNEQLAGDNSTKIEFSFEQCIGGVCFVVSSEHNIFQDLNFKHELSACEGSSYSSEVLIQMLTNELCVIDEGKGLEMIFYVNGIEPEQLINRQQQIKAYLQKSKIKQ
jgi:hypothetical protein